MLHVFKRKALSAVFGIFAMQYVLKLTPLGVKPHVFRVVSVDGQADVAHVLNLCDLSFDYAHYPERCLYFAQDKKAVQELNFDHPEVDDDHYGPVATAFAPFWQRCVDVDSIALSKYDLQVEKRAAVQRFDELLTGFAAMINDTVAVDTHPQAQSIHFKFLYVVHGVQHLVEVLMASAKLNCFLPATLMGEGLIIDDDPSCPLSTELINACIAQEEAAQLLVEPDSCGTDVVSDMGAVDRDGAPHVSTIQETGLNLKVCTARMRALGAQRSAASANEALVQAGASPLVIKAY